MFLETRRVKLEEFSPDDVSLLQDLDSDPEVMRYLTDARPSSEEEVKATLERILALSVKYKGKFGVWKAIEKDSSEFLGWFAFRPCKTDPDNLNDIELGYRLKQKFWGKGFASEVSLALIEKGLHEYKLNSIWAKTMKENLGSQGVMKKCGLKFEREFTENDFPGADKRGVRFSITR